MRQYLLVLAAVCLLVGAGTAPVVADWVPADGHKMHFPQLPDENGYDVHATYPLVLADDFMCTETGWIKDIHFWGSWLHGMPGNILSFDLSIHADIPASPPEIPYSRPGELLWFRNVTVFIAHPIPGAMIEDWYDPRTGEVIFNDHTEYWQYNVFLPEPDWFMQDSGRIYWLDITAHVEDTLATRWGWKSSLDYWNDNAVWAEGFGACLDDDVDGDGTPELPAQCPYIAPDGIMQITDGLPPGTTIDIIPVIDVPFLNDMEYTGGSLGGNWHEFDAVMVMKMTGTGMLAGYSRTVDVPVHVEVHTAPRTPGDDPQECVALIWSMTGQMTGDPDFDLLRITAGDGSGMPSPGEFTIKKKQENRYWVESFFDITYRIDFVGAPGGLLAGLSGSTTGTCGMEQQGDDIAWNELAEPSIEAPIENLWWIGFDPFGNPMDMGATGFYGAGWYFYDTSEWWNVWFYDHPYDPTRFKEAMLSFDVFKVDAGQPSFVEIALNYSTAWWSLVGNPEPAPRVPPLPGCPEDSAIVRVIVIGGPDIQGHFEIPIVLPEYNPEWVSVDVRGFNYIIPEGMGRLTHACLPQSAEPLPLDLAFVITGEPPELGWNCDDNPPPGKTGGGTEMEPNDDCSIAIPAQCEYAYCGTILGADVDWWYVDLPSDTCYCLHVRVFGDDTPGQYAYGKGLDPDLTVYAGDCVSQLFYNDNHGGAFPDAVGNDAQYDCLDANNCHGPGERLYLRISNDGNASAGPYLLVINCYPCECPQTPADTVKCEPQGGLNPTHPPTYWYDVTPTVLGRCDFHVQVSDSVLSHYSNWIMPVGWLHSLHKVGAEWWVSWWSPGCVAPISATFRFSFDNPNPSVLGHWTTTVAGSSDPFASLVDSSGRHATDPDGYGYRVHVPRDETIPSTVKWHQPPDLNPTGIDIHATSPMILADDFLCTNTGPITEIHVYGSWFQDQFPGLDPGNVVFQLSLHADIPVGPDGWSIPGPMLWIRPFGPGEFTYRLHAGGLQEGWYDPLTGAYHPLGDTQCWEYIFYLHEDEFIQQGTVDQPVIYWLDVQAMPQEEAYFGWKTTSLPHRWNDDAVWSHGMEPPTNPWIEMIYPELHPWHPESLDLAFSIHGPLSGVTGACCRHHACTQETQVSCLSGGGYYMGDGWPCTPDPCCCVAMGNVDGSSDLQVTMGDLTVLIDHLFISYSPLNCWPEGNVDLSPDYQVTMGDLTVMIDHLFLTYTPMPSCPW